jgi:hypothetical protein
LWLSFSGSLAEILKQKMGRRVVRLSGEAEKKRTSQPLFKLKRLGEKTI